jgi:hypothetical protein
MGMIEVGYQIRDYTNIYIASENESVLSPGFGSRPYSNYINGITGLTTLQGFAANIVDQYSNWLDAPESEGGRNGKIGYTISAVDLTKIDPLVSAIGDFGRAVSLQMPGIAPQIQITRSSTQKFDSIFQSSNPVIDDSDEYVDLIDLAGRFMVDFSDPGIQDAALSVTTAANAYVIYNETNPGTQYYPASMLVKNHIHGVSIFFPLGDKKRSFYSCENLAFACDANWYPLLGKLGLSDAVSLPEWGTFLVDYVEAITPSAPDNPNPPDLVSPVSFDPPIVSYITLGNPNPTSAASVNFAVVFSKPVSGVEADDFVTTTTGVTGATVTGVIPVSDTIYTVTVNTGFGSGTIRLNVVDDDSIKDGANNPLGGVGLGNGNFTSGEAYTIFHIPDTTGVFRPSNGLLYLKNTNATGFADVAINYGTGGDYPVVGDWDGDGDATIGIYRNSSFYLRNSNTLGFADLVFAFGQLGDQPVAGDWNGDGTDTIGIYRPSTGQFLLRDDNSAGTADYSFYLGNVGDVGIAGDWTAKGFDTVGVFRPSNGIIFLKNTNETGFADIALNYGLAGDQPVVGDWDGNGTDTIGVYRNAQFLLRNSNDIGFADLVFALGNPGDMPIAGDWDGLP